MNKTLFCGLLGITAAGLWTAVPALAQDAGDKAEARRARLLERHPEADTNGDGQLSEAEAKAFFQNRAGRSARAGQGRMAGGVDGPSARPRPNPEQILENNPEADTDGDGKLSKEEMRALWEARREENRKALLEAHPELDADGDGQLSPEERQVGQDTIEAYMKARRAEQLLKTHPEADTNGDGKLSEAEMEAFSRRNRSNPQGGPNQAVMAIDLIIRGFDRIDTNGDGNITKEELAQAKARLQKASTAGPSGSEGARSRRRGADNGEAPGPADTDSPRPRGQRRAGRAGR